MIYFTHSQGELEFSKYGNLNALFTAAQNYAGGCFMRYISRHNETKPPAYGKLSLTSDLRASSCKLVGLGNSEKMRLYVVVTGTITQTYPDGETSTVKHDHEYFYEVYP